MKHFYIIANSQKKGTCEEALRIQDFLIRNQASCAIAQVQAAEETDREEMGETGDEPGTLTLPADTDCVLVLGGDGTLLRASRSLVKARQAHIPLLGINMGTLGYLAEIEVANAGEALQELLAGRYSIESRMMLSGEVVRGGQVIMQDIALNDIVIARRGHLRVVDFKILVNGAFLCSYRADGIILSTATGSTGYSLSAGGPIVSPDASLILMTAIAPHTLNSRTVVLPDSVEITVETAGREFTETAGAEVNFDGAASLSLLAGDQIRIRRAAQQTRLVKLRNTSFVEILRSKMN